MTIGRRAAKAMPWRLPRGWLITVATVRGREVQPRVRMSRPWLILLGRGGATIILLVPLARSQPVEDYTLEADPWLK